MSTLFGQSPAFRLSPPAPSGTGLHQKNSWRALSASRHLVRRWAARRSQRLALGELNAQQLDDIGLTRAQALGEAAKPFWKP